MSMKSKIFDSFLLYASFNFFTLKGGSWNIDWLFQRNILGWSQNGDVFCASAWSPCWSTVRPSHRTALAVRTRDIWHTVWITLVDLGVNLLWYLVGLFGGPQMRILGGFLTFFPCPSSFCFLVSFSFSLYFKLFFTLIYDVVFWCCFSILIFYVDFWLWLLALIFFLWLLTLIFEVCYWSWL